MGGELITREEFRKEIDRYIEKARFELEEAMTMLSTDHPIAFAQITSHTGLMNRLQVYLSDISMKETDKLITNPEDYVYIKEGDALKRMYKKLYNLDLENVEPPNSNNEIYR